MDVWEVFKAIKTKFDSDTTAGSAYTLTGGRFRYEMARQEDTLPYIVYTQIDTVHDWTCDDDIDIFRMQFSIWSDNASASEVCSIANALTILFDDATVSAAGWVQVYCWRDSARGPYKDGDYWRYDIDYRLRYVESTTTTTTTTAA